MEGQKGPTIQYMELCSKHVAACMGGEFGGEGIQVCV